MATELKEKELENQALSWPEKAQAITIVDQGSYDKATGLLIDIAALEKEIIDHHKPIKDAAFAAHKAAVAAEKRLLDPLAQAKGILKGGIGVWMREQERIRQEAERKAREEQARLEEEARLKLAVQAEEMGASEETTEEILSTPMPVEIPVVPPTYQKTKGVSAGQRWRAEVYNIKMLCAAIAEGKASSEMVQPNMTALNAMARAMKSTFNLPGVRAVPETTVSVRR